MKWRLHQKTYTYGGIYSENGMLAEEPIPFKVYLRLLVEFEVSYFVKRGIVKALSDQ